MDIKKQQRLQLLERQTYLYQNHCKSCDYNARNTQKYCEQCDVYKELRSIGDALLSPKKVKYEQKQRAKIESVKEVKKEDKTVAKKVTITVERYKELKEKGYTDKAIRDEFGYHNAMFYDWKKKHGLCNENKTVKKKSKQEVIREKDVIPEKLADDTFEQIKNEIKKLQSENSSLKEEIQYLRKENDELKLNIREHIVDAEAAEEKAAALEEKIKELQFDVQSWREAASKWEAEAKDLDGELDKLKAHNNVLNNVLKDENEDLKLKLKAIKERNEELLVEINQLRNSQVECSVPHQNLLKALLEYVSHVTS